MACESLGSPRDPPALPALSGGEETDDRARGGHFMDELGSLAYNIATVWLGGIFFFIMLPSMFGVSLGISEVYMRILVKMLEVRRVRVVCVCATFCSTPESLRHSPLTQRPDRVRSARMCDSIIAAASGSCALPVRMCDFLCNHCNKVYAQCVCATIS